MNPLFCTMLRALLQTTRSTVGEGYQMRRGYTLLWRKIWANPLLVEPGKKFSRLEAWLYIVNVLAAGMDDEKTGLKRGEFVASIRFLSKTFNWSHAIAQRFIDQFLENSMIARLIRESTRPAVQDAGHFIICNYGTYNQTRYTERYGERYADRYNIKEVIKEGLKEVEKKDTPAFAEASAGMRVPAGRSFSEGRSPKTLIEIYKQQNQLLPEVKAHTSERLKKCRSRIDQAVRDGCLEQYLADFTEAVKKAQQTPFLRGEGVRGWRASFDWFVANHVNIYAVLEGKYDGPAGPNNGNGGSHAATGDYFDCDPGETSTRRTSRGEPIYRPRQ
jgi:hypothetical protein